MSCFALSTLRRRGRCCAGAWTPQDERVRRATLPTPPVQLYEAWRLNPTDASIGFEAASALLAAGDRDTCARILSRLSTSGEAAVSAQAKEFLARLQATQQSKTSASEPSLQETVEWLARAVVSSAPPAYVTNYKGAARVYGRYSRAVATMDPCKIIARSKWVPSDRNTEISEREHSLTFKDLDIGSVRIDTSGLEPGIGTFNGVSLHFLDGSPIMFVTGNVTAAPGQFVHPLFSLPITER